MENPQWSWVLDFSYLSMALILAAFIRNRVQFLQNLLITSSIIAGALILALGYHSIGIINVQPERFEGYAYHLLAAVFISVGLRGSGKSTAHGIVTTAAVLSKGLAIMFFLGAAFMIFWITLVSPGLFPGLGFQFMLGFGYDHLIAYDFGLQWEQFGLMGGRYPGFTFGVVGFLWSYLAGIFLINWARKNKLLAVQQDGKDDHPGRGGILPREEQKKTAGRLTTGSESIESFTIHAALIGLGLFVTYTGMTIILGWLERTGVTGAIFAGYLWKFNFVFALVIGLLIRRALEWLEADHIMNDGLLARAGGALTDYLIAAAIASIPLVLFTFYRVEILVLSTLGGAVLLAGIVFLSRRMQRDFAMERSIAVFGFLSGNIASGIALLRAVDPELKSPVVGDLAYAGGLSLFLGFPLLLLMNYPVDGFLAGAAVPYLFLALGLVILYSAVLFMSWFVLNKYIFKEN